MKLYYHKTNGEAEYLCSEAVKGTNEGSFNSKYIVRIDGNIKEDAELLIKENHKKWIDKSKGKPESETNGYKCVKCETGEGETHSSYCSKAKKYIDDSVIKRIDLLIYISETSKTKAYIKEQKEIGEDPDSEWDKGYDSALDSIREFIGD